MQTLLHVFHQPYKMIVVSLSASIMLGVGLILFRKLFPKRKISLFILLLFIMVLPVLSVFRPGSYDSGDLTLHAKYAMQFFDNLTQGNLIPQWIGNNDCSNYGCPEFMFIFFLPYYVIAFFHAIGFSFIFSVKLLIIVSYFLSGIGMYIWMKEEVGKLPAFVAAIFYLFAPYHLIDMSFRVSIGELLSLAILPYTFFMIKKVIEKQTILSFSIASLTLTLLVLSHQATALISFPIIFAYGCIVWMRQKKKKLKEIALPVSTFLVSMLLSAFYWIPLLYYGKDIWYAKDNAISFHTFWDAFFAPNQFGFLFQGHMGELYMNVGYTQWFIVLLALFLLWKQKITKSYRLLLIVSLSIFFILFLLMQSFTKPIWDILSFLKSIQFAWRLLLEMSLLVAVIAGIVVKHINSKTCIYILCFLTILYTILNWGNRKTVPLTDSQIVNQPMFQELPGTVELTTPVWVNRYAPWIGIYQANHLQVLSGNAKIKQITRMETIHIYSVSVQKTAVLKENTYFFPGWEVFANNKQVAINYKNKKYQGVITFPLSKGTYVVRVQYFYTSISQFAQKLSGLTAVVLLFITGVGLIKKGKRPKKLKTIPKRKIHMS